MKNDISLSGSLEDYIEAIYNLIEHNQEARVKPIADELNVKKSSVTVALRALAKKKLIHYTPYSDVTLTEQGQTLAQDVIRRHETLKEFFTNVLAVDENQAEESACKMEHVLTKEMTEKLIQFMEYMVVCPRHGLNWLEKFQNYCKEKQSAPLCEECLEQSKQEIVDSTSAKTQLELVVPLSSLKPKSKAQIVKITHKGAFRKRILEMGVTTGAVLAIERMAPLGDPIDIKIRGYHLSLRKEEAQHIMVKTI